MNGNQLTRKDRQTDISSGIVSEPLCGTPSGSMSSHCLLSCVLIKLINTYSISLLTLQTIFN